MAPGLLSESVFDTLGLVGVSVSVNALLLDLTLRAVGFVLFVLFALRTDGRSTARATERERPTRQRDRPRPSPPPTRPERLSRFERDF